MSTNEDEPETDEEQNENNERVDDGEVDEEFRDAMDGDRADESEEISEEPSEEWSLGEQKTEKGRVGDTVTLMEEPMDQSVFDQLGTPDQGEDAMYRTAKIVTAKPKLNRRVWDEEFSPRQRMQYGLECMKFAGVLDIVQTLDGDFMGRAIEAGQERMREQSANGNGGE